MAAEAVSRRADTKALQDVALRLTDESSLTECLDAYAERVWAPGTVIALLIDEAQRCKVHDEQTKDNILALYDGDHKVRMPLLFFGLPDAGSVLYALGLSRLPDSVAKTMGRLEKGEGGEVLERTFNALGLSAQGDAGWQAHLKDSGISVPEWTKWREKLIKRLESESQDFPQHLAVGLSAACVGILRTEKGASFDDALLQDIADDHQERREGYYEGRLESGALAPHALAFGAICALFSRREADVIRRGEAMELLVAGHQAQLGGGALNADQVLNVAVAKGVFGHVKSKAARPITPPPIPSMQTHVEHGFLQGLDEGEPAALALQTVLDRLAPPAQTQSRRAEIKAGFGLRDGP